jgi:hypothetical protein
MNVVLQCCGLKYIPPFHHKASRTEQSVQQSVLLVREKYEATKVLEVGGIRSNLSPYTTL